MSDTPRTDVESEAISRDCDIELSWSDIERALNFSRGLERELAAVKEQLAEARRDAERYQYLRREDELKNGCGLFIAWRVPSAQNAISRWTGESADKVIDEAMKEPA